MRACLPGSIRSDGPLKLCEGLPVQIASTRGQPARSFTLFGPDDYRSSSFLTTPVP